ncbi:sensor histidine kinase [Phenylobacterium sp.]|uniref:sensor histidine kinase n=1 Tax=Phenylobacterium sp. TaxID=1871053 RepID=UPI0035C7B5C6
MRRRGHGRPTASLFVQVLLLVGLSLIIAQAISVFLLFNLPPPVPDFYRFSEIEQALEGSPPELIDRRPLQHRIVDSRPSDDSPGETMIWARDELADDLGVPHEDIVVAKTYRLPISDRRVFRIVRDRMERAGGEGAEDRFLVAPFEIAMKRPDGRWSVVRPEPGFGLNVWQQRVLLWFLLSSLVMAPIAYLFAKRLSQPFRLFAEAAERLGRDPDAPPLAIRGSAEISVAVKAFNGMQERLRRYVQDRTAMVGAIAHDLRTPLTRLRFRIESAPEDQRAKMAADIDQMEAMVAATLGFVRDATRPGKRTRLELASLVESVCDEMAETGAAIEVEDAQKVVVFGDPVALRRLVTNLAENAIKFGGSARARVFTEERSAIVEIADEGPGIPEAEIERVFEPFYRREPSRSRETGGIGLGLAVVRSIARAHGGDVVMANRLGGGLTARVILPI